MGQEGIMRVLEESESYLTAREISLIMGVSRSNVSRALSILVKSGDVDMKLLKIPFYNLKPQDEVVLLN